LELDWRLTAEPWWYDPNLPQLVIAELKQSSIESMANKDYLDRQ
jgi:hypothetical protein